MVSHRGRVRRFVLLGGLVTILAAGGWFGFRAISKGSTERHLELRTRAVELMSAGDHESARLLLSRLESEGGAANVDRVNLAISMQATGRNDDALAVLERVVATSPGYAPAHSQLAGLCYERGRIAIALDHALAALDRLPTDPQARLIAGLASYDLGRMSEARAHLRAVKDEDPGRIEALLRLAAIGGGDADRYLREADRKISQRAGGRRVDPEVGALRARSLAIAGKDGQALAAALAVLRQTPDHLPCLEIAIRELPATKEETVLLLLTAAEKSTGPDLVAALHARWLGRHGRTEEALTRIQGLTSSQAALVRLELYRDAGRYRDALGALSALPESTRARPEFAEEEVRLLARTGQLAAAVRSFTDLAARQPDRSHRDALEALVRAIERVPATPVADGAAEQLLPLIRKSARREPALAALEARVLLSQGRYEEAGRILDRPELSASQDPAAVQAGINRLIHRGQIDQAFRRLRNFEDALDDAGLIRLAEIALRTGKPELAEKLLRRIDPTRLTEEAQRILATALLRQGRIADAEKRLRTSTAPRLVLLHAEALARLDRMEDAVRRAVEVEAGGGIVAGRALRAWWLVTAGDRTGAAAILFDAELPVDVRQRAVLGLAERLARQGRANEELRWLRQARVRLPADAEALGRLVLAEQRNGLKRPETVKLRVPARRLAGSREPSRSLILALAFFSLIDGDVPAARTTASDVLSRRPLDADARRLAAYVALREGRIDDARRHLVCLLSVRPRDAAARGLLNAVDFRSGAAFEVRPNAPRAVLLAALRKGVGSGDLDRARGALDSLGLTKESEFLNHLSSLNAALAGQRLEQALGHARAMVKLRPVSPVAHFRLGLVLVSLDRREEGSESFREAARRAPDWPAPAVALVRALIGTDRRDAAREWLEARLLERPRDAVTFALLSEVRAAGKDLSGAIAFARRSEEIGGAEALSRPALVRALLQGRGAEEAYAAALRFVEDVDEPEPRDMVLAGQAGLAAGRLVEAAALFRRAPGRLGARTGLAEIHALSGETKEALEQAEAAARMAPDDAAVVFLHAALLETVGRTDGAVAGYERVLKLAPGHALASLNLSRHLAGRDDPRALALSAAALAALPEEPEAIRGRAYVLEKAGRAAEATALREKLTSPSRSGD